ncbi:MAG: BREX system Lon protease-like protein BrxL [Caulobacterales bacterium]|nr:BREX system Lon protease-like protein BrxL [Caulobacterales bacterium]
MEELDTKISTVFEGMVVRKDLVKKVKGNAIVPSFVLEFLLGQNCATNDEESIKSGIERVKEILRNHYVHRNESELIKSKTKENGRHKVIDKIGVTLNDKKGVYEATFSNLGIKKVLVDTATIKKHPKLLVSGVWCIADIGYEYSEDKDVVPWLLHTIKPIQLSDFDFEEYIEKRSQFTTDEWIDLLVQSVGFNPNELSKRSKLIQLIRLIPFCERNYNLIELGPKGTGKSHIYSEFSPHGILVSGGEVTVPKLFVNNSTNQIGLVGFWDTVAFDEFAGKNKRVDKALVDIMKNYMANKSFSRGVETLGAEASMVFIGNTQHNVPYMLKHSDLFDELPDSYHDSAFLDRMHFYIPGWEVDIIRSEMFSSGYGFVVDYLAEILRHLRNHDYSQEFSEHFTILSDISTRDRDAILKTFSGLFKIIFPNRIATTDEIKDLLSFAIEGRKRVKDQLLRIDSTFNNTKFGFVASSNCEYLIQTAEEKEYPQYYYKRATTSGASSNEANEVEVSASDVQIAPEQVPNNSSIQSPFKKDTIPVAGHFVYEEGTKGISYKRLFEPYIKGATKLEITDPYIRLFYQCKNLMDFIELVANLKDDADEVEVKLVTIEEGNDDYKQIDFLTSIQRNALLLGVKFNWSFDRTNTIHARSIITDTGWKITIDRGLDIFQNFDTKDTFSVFSRNQKYRSVKLFEITYIDIGNES